MKILHLANTPLSNSPANIASVQRHIGHDSRVLLHQKSNRNKIFVGGELWAEHTTGELTDIFDKSEIIHFHNFTWTQAIFKSHPHLKEIAMRKKCFVQFHSARKAHEDFEDVLVDSFFNNKRLVIAQYHPREYPECEHIVPNPIPMHEDRFRLIKKGKWIDFPPISVSYAPSNGTLKGWDYKGYDKIAPALRTLNNTVINSEILFGAPYEDCLKSKSYCHIGIEEFFTGSYHLSFLEYMALQCSTIGYLDEQTKAAMETFVGIDAVRQLPYTEAKDTASLLHELNVASWNPESITIKAIQARAWMEENWSSEKTAKAYIDVYEKA